jgi:histidinol-phosphate aminotransferase
MRVGLAFASSEIVSGLRKVKDSYNLDRLAIVAAAASLADREWTRANIERIKKTRERLATALRALGLEVLPSEANFVLARFATREGARAAFEHLEKNGILVRYFDVPELWDGLRISVGTDEEIDALLSALGPVGSG